MLGASFSGVIPSPAVNPRDLLVDQSALLEPGRQEPGPQAIHKRSQLGGLLALLTALYEDNVQAVAVRGGLVSFHSVLLDRFCYMPQDMVVPGILERGTLGRCRGIVTPSGTACEPRGRPEPALEPGGVG